jgi:putative acetyltransferase
MIRPERESDLAAVRRVNLAAFPTALEADLVDALRGSIAPLISLVAEVGGEVAGHILFTPVTVEQDRGGADVWRALALGPMAVLPAHQGRGIGSALVQAGLDECRRRGERAVFVLGHPEFYPRFGFVPAAPLGFQCQWDVPPEAFMVAELAPGAIAGRRGKVVYHPAFGAA